MKKVANFYKVSESEFLKASTANYNDIVLPKRATAGITSA